MSGSRVSLVILNILSVSENFMKRERQTNLDQLDPIVKYCIACVAKD